ncbi:uncharacterized protein UV8b_06033 [Ustilaginoidea virens]|uniref:Uncharacterized protein n=1 Tax=Ustilaginoidea virens TaxID=1159556 RepID=A0A063BLW1_USTVR|nr:uncharacterized protein UV8b_06033 [Ustilaginoidea virens]QUC21786.1 hypothetical protein UV8b_06033 [Ustilaginoidea virens]GAO17422.1 hypothetical protein UVI_02052360 [Ustilaginoidea virens]
MNSPPGGVKTAPHSRLASETLTNRLENLAEAQQNATPEPEDAEDAEESYRWRCEELRNHFTPAEAETYRNDIASSAYWMVEYNQYKTALEDMMLQRARAAQARDLAICPWQALAMSYKGVLKRCGLSLAGAKEIRHSIDDQMYWRLEAEVYQQRVASQEAGMRARQMGERKKQPSPRQAVQKGRPRPINQKRPPEGGIARRTRSQTKTLAKAGVVKRVERVRR